MIKILFFCMAVILISCGKKEEKVRIPAMERTPLSSILENPTQYHDKKVLLQGEVSDFCVSGCEFTYKEGTKTIPIYPMGFKLPKMRKGDRVKVYAEVKVGTERVIIYALAMEKEKR